LCQNHPDEQAPQNHSILLKLGGRSIGTTRLDDLGNGIGVVRRVAEPMPRSIGASCHRFTQCGPMSDRTLPHAPVASSILP
jgi:hypothetical protein